MPSPPPGSRSLSPSGLKVWAGEALACPQLLPASRGTVKEEGALGSPLRALWPRGSPTKNPPSWSLSRQICFGRTRGWGRWSRTRRALGSASFAISRGRAAAPDPWLPGRRAMAWDPEKHPKGPGRAGHQGRAPPRRDPPHLSAPPPGRDCRPRGPRPRPFVMHMRAPRLRKGPLQTLRHR